MAIELCAPDVRVHRHAVRDLDGGEARIEQNEHTPFESVKEVAVHLVSSVHGLFGR
jgi:hypothetical protein